MVGQAHVLLARRDGVSLAGVAWRGTEREVAGGSLELEHVIWTGEPFDSRRTAGWRVPDGRERHEMSPVLPAIRPANRRHARPANQRRSVSLPGCNVCVVSISSVVELSKGSAQGGRRPGTTGEGHGNRGCGRVERWREGKWDMAGGSSILHCNEWMCLPPLQPRP